MKNKRVVGFASEIVVVGQDYEYSDLDNPHGFIYGEQFYIVAEDQEGNRRTWGNYYDSPQAAEFDYIHFSPPVEFWMDITPAYGSEAYANNRWEYEADIENRERDLEGVDRVSWF